MEMQNLAREPRSIVLFASHRPGIEIADYFQRVSCDQVLALYLTGQDEKTDEAIISALKMPSERVFMGKSVLNDHGHFAWLAAQKVDAVVTVYWPYLLKKEVFRLAKKTVNFHPALLPINRGWYPHVHSLIDGSPSGVTLHALEIEADTGDIWAQKEVSILPTETAKDLYLRLQQEIVALFKETWEDIMQDKIIPQPQDHSSAVYHSKSSVAQYDHIDLDANCTPRQFINLLRARSFGDKGFAFYEEDGKKIYVNLRLSTNPDFS